MLGGRSSPSWSEAMDELGNAVQRVLLGQLEQLLARSVRKKLLAAGIRLSRRDEKRLVEHLMRGEDSEIQLQGWRWWDTRDVELHFDDADLEQIELEFNREVLDLLPAALESVLDEAGGNLLRSLKRSWRRESRRQTRRESGFQRRLRRRWKLPLERLRMLNTIAREYGENLGSGLRESLARESPFLVDVAMRLHARGSQVAAEIITLLRGGFADAAMARWRTLHEVSVVAMFITLHGESVAERYAMHEHVESRKAAREYQARHERLGYEPMTDAEVSAIEEAYSTCIDRFGPSFRHQYGWAADQLGSEQPAFAEIEEAVGIDHLRPFYRLASHGVHANPKGVFFQLGLLEETGVLLAGASNAGLSEPGQAAASSVVQISGALLGLQPTLDNILVVRLMLELANEIQAAFLDAGEALKRDAAAG